MSDDNKNLSDDLDDMIGDAKEGAKNVGDKISSSAKEFASDAKEKASEYADEAKASTKEFANAAKHVLEDGKNVAIIAHITLIGCIIAIVMNSSNKTEYGSFYVRQVLGIMLLGFVCSIVPVVNFIAWILPVAMWIMSLIGALSGEKKPVFLLGNQFQEWLKSI